MGYSASAGGSGEGPEGPTDIGVVAAEPDLFNFARVPRRTGPEHRRERFPGFVERQRVESAAIDDHLHRLCLAAFDGELTADVDMSAALLDRHGDGAGRRLEACRIGEA